MHPLLSIRSAMIAVVAMTSTPPSVVAFCPAPLHHSKYHTKFNNGLQPRALSKNNDEQPPPPPPVVAADDLSKEDLLLRLFEARDYYRRRPEEGMTQANVCRLLLRTRLPNLRLNRCHVATSGVAPNAGNGVFASRDIEGGELCTLYPGDALLIQDAGASNTRREDDDDDAKPASPVGVMFGSHVRKEDRDATRVTSHEARSYEMEINDWSSIVADPAVGAEGHSYMGHICNDGAALFEFDEVSRELYTNATAEACNVEHIVMEGAHMGTIATRAIKKGEELLVSYGEGYWLSRSDPSLITKKTGIVVEIADAAGAAQGSSTSPSAAAAVAVAGSQSRSDRRSKKRKNNKKSPNGKRSTKGFGS